MKKTIKRLVKLAKKNGFVEAGYAKHGVKYRHPNYPRAITNIGGTPSGDAGNYYKVKVKDLRKALEAAGGTFVL